MRSLTTRSHVAAVTAASFFLVMAHCTRASDISDAIHADDTAKVQTLLQTSPAVVNEKDHEGTTPLHLAAARNRVAVIEALVAHGAKIEALRSDGWTPLHVAATLNSVAAVEALLAHGANAAALTQSGCTPLDFALTCGASATVRVLLEKTAAGSQGDVFGRLKTAPVTDVVQAATVLATLVRETPDNEHINLTYGLLCAASGEDGKAQMAFGRVLQNNPNNYRARLELARSWLHMGNCDLARQSFQVLLADDIPADVQNQAHGYLQNLDHDPARKWFTVRTETGWVNDDNANVGPSSVIIPIAPIFIGEQEIRSLTVAEGSQPVHASGPYAGAVLSVIAGQPDGWQGLANALWYQNWLNKDEYSTLYAGTDLGVQRSQRNSLLQIPFRCAHVDVGYSSLVDILGLHPTYTRISSQTPRLVWETRTGGDWRNYNNLDRRDGIYVSAGQHARYGFNGRLRSISAGVVLAHDFTTEGVFENTALGGEMGAKAALLTRLDLYGKIRYMRSAYREKEILAPEDRRDNQWQYGVGLAFRATSRIQITLDHQITDSSSTFALYEYNRQITTVGARWEF